MSVFLRKYNVADAILIPIEKAGSSDFVNGTEWFPAAGDVKLSRDSGAVVNITTLPIPVAGTGSVLWWVQLSLAELNAKKVTIQIVDQSTPKVIKDQAIIIETTGSSISGQYAFDLNDPVRAGLTALPDADANAAGGLPISIAGGLDLDAMNININDIETDTADMQPKLGTPAADIAADLAAVKVDTAATLVDTAQIGLAGAGLTDLGGMSATMKGQVNAEADIALTDYDAPTNTEMVAAFTEIKGATWATTDTLEAIRDRGDAAWLTATGFSTFNAATDAVANVTLVATTTAVTNTINVNVEQISGSNVVETTAGRIVGNFNTFFDNADAATTKTVDNVGSVTSGGDASLAKQNDILDIIQAKR